MGGRLIIFILCKAQLSLSRFNHWLPRCETHPEVMQGTTECHSPSADAVLPPPDAVLHDAAALDAAVHMLDPQPTVVQGLVGPWLFQGAIRPTGVLGRPQDRPLRPRQRQQTQLLQPPTPGGQGLRRRGSHGLLLDATALGVTEQEEEEQGLHAPNLFDRVVLLLAALTRRLFRRGVGADEAPFRPVVGQRGDAGAPAGAAATGAGASARGVTTLAASASVTPSRCARAVRARAGAAPRGRRAASHAGKSRWLP